MKASVLEAGDSLEAVNDLLEARGWSDGLPVVPPTPARVERMLAHFDVDREQELATVAPARGVLTFEKLVINAVMAGCGPRHVPVVAAAMAAMCDPAFNLSGVQGTTGPHAPLCIVSGPARGAAGIGGGSNCFGQGTRGNAVVGRALRLILQNVGGGVPGRVDMATMGHPGKFGFCIAENEEASPWESLAAERGFGAGQGAVTVAACDAPHVVVDNTSTTAEGLLQTLSGSLRSVGCIQYYMIGRGMELVVVLGPEHAAEIARAGWTKRDVKDYLYETARLPLAALQDRGMYGNRTWPKWCEALLPADLIPAVASPDRIIVLVAGGPGRVSCFLPTWHTSRSVSVPVDLAVRAGAG